MRTYILSLLCIIPLILNAQRPQGKLSGRVVDKQNNQPLEYATAALYKKDSSLVNGIAANDKGYFELEAPYGDYFIKIDLISYEAVVKDISLNSNNTYVNLGTISLAPEVTQLKEVEVTGEKNQVQLALDKRVFNVDKSLAAMGGTATDVLENVPSVTVDQDGNVQLRGNGNVRILIDGKPSGLTGISTSDVLKQLPANSIESIEVITNPSARYDAEGMAGIINIKLKKERNKGFNGMLNLTGGYPHEHNGNFSFNYRKSKFNLFGSLGANYAVYGADLINNRTVRMNDVTQTINQKGSWSYNVLGQNYRLGSDLFLTPTATLTLSSFYHHSTAPIPSEFRYDFLDGNNTLQQVLVRATNDLSLNNNFDHNILFKKNFKREGQELSADARFTHGMEESEMTASREFFSPDMKFLYEGPEQRTFTHEAQKALTAQVDYIHPFGKGSKFELGAKTINRELTAVFGVEELNSVSNTFEKLGLYSDTYIYNEGLHSLYGIYGGSKDKFSWQAGVRAEQTMLDGRMLDKELNFNKSYLGLFPSVHVSYDAGKQNTLQLSYSRRINRPDFWALNPFPRFFDPLNAFAGNPDLNPEYTNLFELTNLKYWKSGSLSAGIYYQHTNGVHQRLRFYDEATGMTKIIPVNVGEDDGYGMEIIVSKDLFKIWKLSGNINAFRSVTYGTALGESFHTDWYGLSSRLNSQFKLPKEFELQVTAGYESPRTTAQGKILGRYGVDAGVRKSLFSRKGSLGVRFSDVFNSRQWVIITEQQGLSFYVVHKPITQRIFVNFTYRINNFRPQERRQEQPSGGGEIGF